LLFIRNAQIHTSNVAGSQAGDSHCGHQYNSR
jgi:hypothetical protein